MGTSAFIDRPDNIAFLDHIAFLDLGLEVPLLLVVDAGCVDPPCDEAAGFFLDRRQRSLQAVVDPAEDAGTELDGQRVASILDRFTWFDAGRGLVHLDVRLSALDLDDLAEQAFLSYPDNVSHLCVKVFSYHNRSCDTVDLACVCEVVAHSIIYPQISTPSACFTFARRSSDSPCLDSGTTTGSTEFWMSTRRFCGSRLKWS